MLRQLPIRSRHRAVEEARLRYYCHRCCYLLYALTVHRVPFFNIVSLATNCPDLYSTSTAFIFLHFVFSIWDLFFLFLSIFFLFPLRTFNLSQSLFIIIIYSRVFFFWSETRIFTLFFSKSKKPKCLYTVVIKWILSRMN